MFTVIGLMIAGFFLGLVFRKNKIISEIDKSVIYVIYFLLFFLGISIGINKEIVNHLGSLGWTAFLIAIGSIAGSVGLAYFLYIFLFKND